MRSVPAFLVNDCYDNRLQPTSITATPVHSSIPSALNYTYFWRIGYQDNGDLIYQNNVNSVGYSKFYYYDAYNRIEEYKTPNSSTWDVKYLTDAWGNLLSKNPQSCCGGETFNSGGATDANQIATGYGYDANGNVTSDPAHNAYSYDPENRITTVAGVTYTYDGESERVQKSTGESYWGGGAGTALLETDNSGNPTEEYVYFLGERLARRDIPSGAIHYYFNDNIGSATVITDNQGNLQAQYDYAPYGELHRQVGTDPNHYLFTGKERDTETGNDYFGARYYQSAMGKFITPDWAATPEAIPYADMALPQSLNLYGYVKNDPTVRIDADGHDVTFEDAKLAQQTTRLASQSGTFGTELDEARKDHTVDRPQEI